MSFPESNELNFTVTYLPVLKYAFSNLPHEQKYFLTRTYTKTYKEKCIIIIHLNTTNQV